MASELQTATTTGSSVYAIIRNSAAQVWNTSTTAFETFSNANWSSYKVALTEQGSSGYYVGSFPTGITTADNFGIEFYSGSGIETDTYIAGGSLSWNGLTASYAPTGTALVSLSYVKDFGNIQVTTYDGYLTNRIAAASAEIVAYCHNNFTAANYTDVLDGNGSTTLLLANTPVTAVTSVTIGYNGNNPTVISGSSIMIDSANGLISINPNGNLFAWFPYGFQDIQVIYSAGFSSIPLDVQEAAAKMVMNKFTSRGLDMTMDGERIGDYNYKRRPDAYRSITPDIEAVLFKYKELVV